jgi:hypothetical protein
MIKDLRIHGEKNVLVKKTRAAIDPVLLAKYSTVEIMYPYIERYCDVYSKDLADRLSLNDDRHLTDAFATPTLLNPMFGNEKRIVGSGLMSEGQYLKAWHHFLCKMQDIPGKNNPVLCYTLSDNSSSTDDEDDDIPRRDNMNHGKAVEELDEFERFKRKKYQPKVREMTARCLTGELCEIMVGPVEEKRKNLPSGHNLFEYIDIQGRIDLV